MTTAKKSAKKSAAPEWHILDARSMPLGRLATQAAHLLLGKHRLDFAPHKVAPVNVIVINSNDLKVTGEKMSQKMYRHYTGYPGGLRQRSLGEQMKRDSRVVIHSAVSGMLPKNSLRDRRLLNLKVYTGSEHPHTNQPGQQVKQARN